LSKKFIASQEQIEVHALKQMTLIFSHFVVVLRDLQGDTGL
jgi:hypothetical protein